VTGGVGVVCGVATGVCTGCGAGAGAARCVRTGGRGLGAVTSTWGSGV